MLTEILLKVALTDTVQLNPDPNIVFLQ